MHEDVSRRSIVIVGPTASGKSAIAIQIAKEFDGEIIGCDSRQIYRYMDIGTGKEPGKLRINPDTRSQISEAYVCDDIPHYMIDILDPHTPYNVTQYVSRSKEIRTDIWDRKKLPIICGGTGFWAQALVDDIQFPKVEPDLELRTKLDKLSTEELLICLKKFDPERADMLGANNRVHLIRSIEICHHIGKVPKLKVAKMAEHTTLVIAIDIKKEDLHMKIEKRFDGWMAQGLLDEIAMLHDEKNLSYQRIESFGLEYKWGSLLLRNKVSTVEMKENTIRDIKRYAKRQMTWLRRWEKQGRKIHWEYDYTEIHILAQEFLQKK